MLKIKNKQNEVILTSVTFAHHINYIAWKVNRKGHKQKAYEIFYKSLFFNNFPSDSNLKRLKKAKLFITKLYLKCVHKTIYYIIYYLKHVQNVKQNVITVRAC